MFICRSPGWPAQLLSGVSQGPLWSCHEDGAHFGSAVCWILLGKAKDMVPRNRGKGVGDREAVQVNPPTPSLPPTRGPGRARPGEPDSGGQRCVEEWGCFLP